MFSFKIDSITLDPDPNWAEILDPDPNWAEILDPDPNSMYLDPQHCFCGLKLAFSEKFCGKSRYLLNFLFIDPDVERIVYFMIIILFNQSINVSISYNSQYITVFICVAHVVIFWNIGRQESTFKQLLI